MMICRINRKNAGNRGVAIVIVLGLIAVLMMMAVAFSIHMRIERTGAANYRYGVQARHMIYAGLANAIRDIDGLMKDSSVNPPKPIIYPEWDVAVSTQGTVTASVLSRSAAEFLPEPLREIARKKAAKWNMIKDDNNIQRGRYAFVIVNSSGLLDANKVGGLVPRLCGAGSEELRLDNVPGVTGHTQFVTRAMQDIRYENFPELVNKNSFVGDGRSFSMFSLSPVDKYFDINGDLGATVYIGGDQPWDPESSIKTALTLAGVPNEDRVYRNMLDYTDADSLPGRYDECSVEPVPMLNELVVRYRCSMNASNGVSVNARAFLEVWYPFVINGKGPVNLEYEIKVSPRAGNTSTNCLPNLLQTSGPQSVLDVFAGDPIKNQFVRVPIGDVAFSGMEAGPVDVAFDVIVAARLIGPDGKVDEVPSPYVLDNGIKASFSINNLNSGSGVVDTNSWSECEDPRFNWDTAKGGGQWYSSLDYNLVAKGYAHTLDTTNNRTLVAISSTSKDPDRDAAMYTANEAFRSVGELGYIPYDRWQTIRLYQHDFQPTPYPEAVRFHKVLDYFTVWTNHYKRGLINVNTTNLEVLASAFYQMPQQEYITNDLITWAQAEQIADAIIAEGPYTNLSELGKASLSWDTLAPAIPGTPYEICRESLVRNTCGMLTTRDNFFTVIIRADSFSAGIGGKVDKGMSLATSRAVAEVWRDPIPDENGNHRSFVRSFRFVED